MRDLKLLRDKLLEMMDEQLEPYGFKRWREQEWMKSHDWGKAGFHIGFIPHPGTTSFQRLGQLHLDRFEAFVASLGLSQVGNQASLSGDGPNSLK
jgi:hypothetical protein